MSKLFELRQARSAKAAEARKIVETAIAESRDNSPEERQTLDGITAALGEFDRKIAVLERVEAVEADGNRSAGRRTDPLDVAEGPELDGKHQYSLLRAYRCLLNLERGGLESEVNQEIAHRTNRPAQGFYIPWNLVNHRSARESRALNTTTGAGGIANILGTELIQLLRNKMVMSEMGARVMSDMTGGSFSLPKQTSASTAYHVAEGTPVTGSTVTINQVTWVPRTLGAMIDLTRKFVLQTSLDAEGLARDDLMRQVAIGMDAAGLNGSGSGSTPLGIMQDPNVPTLALGTDGGLPTWANVVGLESLVAQANAEFGKLGYVTSNAGRAVMKTTPKIGTTFPVFLWENDRDGVGEVNGRRAFASEQIPSNLTKGSSGAVCTALIYGNWDSATFALWGGLDVIIDPYTGSSSGTIRFVAMQDYDFQCRYENGFAKTVDMKQS